MLSGITELGSLEQESLDNLGWSDGWVINKLFFKNQEENRIKNKLLHSEISDTSIGKIANGGASITKI